MILFFIFGCFRTIITCHTCYFSQVLIYNIMEEEKKKFLLSRIKREEALITSEFQKYKKAYHSKEISSQKTETFLQHISHTVQINNSLASNLHEYLDKPQMEAIFMRINTIFYDLIEKYRKSNNQLTFIQSKRNVKEIRQICDICHDKIETNRIENIRRGLDEESECRAAVIKKLIQDSQLQRTTPVFSEDEDKQFRRQLEKVFKNKELVLQTNIHESNVFLATVEEEIAEFMVSFRKDFAQWGGQQIQEQNQNWGKIMKSYINKKLTNSFNSKIPNWIKKMHELFVDKQPAKPKVYFMNKECQAGIPTQTEEKLTQQLEEINHSLIMKRQALKEKERDLEHEKIRSRALKAELQSLQQYYVDKLYANGKDETAKEKMAEIQEILAAANDNIRTSFVNLRDHNQEKTQLNQRELEDRAKKNKKKFAKLPYQVMIQKSPKDLKQQKSSQNLPYSQIIPSNPIDSKSQKSNQNVINRKQSTPLLSSYEGRASYIDQGGLKLKRKAYNRQKREQMQIDYEKEKKNQSVSYANERQREKSELKDEVKLIGGEISKDLKNKKYSKKSNIQRFNSISITDDCPLPPGHQQTKNTTALILPVTEGLVSLHQQTISSDVKKRASCIPEQITSDINKMEFNQAINVIVQHSKCQQLVTQHVKFRLNKMLQNFFQNLERKNSKSICFQPVKMSKVDLSANKQNQPIPLFKDLEYGSNGSIANIGNNGSIINNRSNGNSGSKSLKKQQQRQLDIILQRRNKSLHAQPLKLPTISIKNYNSNEIQDTSNSKEAFAFFIDEASAKEFEESFDRYQQRHVMKPTPSQLQQIQRMFSELQLLKRRNNPAYLQLCLFMRFPYSSSKQKSSPISIASGFTFPTFCNYFLKVLWLHRECSIEQGKAFCCHVIKFQRRLLLSLPQRKTNKIKRSDRLELKFG